MIFHVFCMIFKCQKIIGIVIQFVTINMMGFFAIKKRSSQFGFDNNNMFKNITLYIGSWMARYQNLLVALFKNKRFSIIKSHTMRRTKFRSLSLWVKLITTIYTDRNSFLRWILKFISVFIAAKVKFSNCRRMFMKILFTIGTLHIIRTVSPRCYQFLSSVFGERSSSLPIAITLSTAKELCLFQSIRKNLNSFPTLRA